MASKHKFKGGLVAVYTPGNDTATWADVVAVEIFDDHAELKIKPSGPPPLGADQHPLGKATSPGELRIVHRATKEEWCLRCELEFVMPEFEYLARNSPPVIGELFEVGTGRLAGRLSVKTEKGIEYVTLTYDIAEQWLVFRPLKNEAERLGFGSRLLDGARDGDLVPLADND